MIAPSAARADYGEETMVRHPGFIRHLGPEEALGVIIWSPGFDSIRNGHPEPLTGAMPHFLDWLYGHGWDVYYMAREGTTQISDRKEHAAAIRRAVRGLARAGYAKIVLGGQSAGGTYQMIAASEDLGLHAIMLFASGPTTGDDSFDDLLANSIAERFVVTHFSEDTTIGTREEARIRGLLEAKARPALLIHEPEGQVGHGAAFQSAFARSFGDCLLKFLDPEGKPASLRTCQ